MATICYNQIMRFGITRRQIKPNKPTRTGIVVRVFPCGNTQSGLQCYRITKETTWGWLGKTTMGCGLCYFQITWLWLSEATYKVVQISPISRLGWWMGVISIVHGEYKHYKPTNITMGAPNRTTPRLPPSPKRCILEAHTIGHSDR